MKNSNCHRAGGEGLCHEKERQKTRNGIELLLTAPSRFELGPAIRLLGQAKKTNDPLGAGVRSQAAVRIHHRLAATVALHEVDDVRLVCPGHSQEGWYELTTPFLNLVGVTGVTEPGFWRSAHRGRSRAARSNHAPARIRVVHGLARQACRSAA